CTPQKQPPARTTVCVVAPAAAAASCVGGGMTTAGSCANAMFAAKPRTGTRSRAPAIVHLLEAIGFLRCAPGDAPSPDGLLSRFAPHAPITNVAGPARGVITAPCTRMIPKSGYRFSDKIMRKRKIILLSDSRG